MFQYWVLLVTGCGGVYPGGNINSLNVSSQPKPLLAGLGLTLMRLILRYYPIRTSMLLVPIKSRVQS
jgi:hypothetical protein